MCILCRVTFCVFIQPGRSDMFLLVTVKTLPTRRRIVFVGKSNVEKYKKLVNVKKYAGIKRDSKGSDIPDAFDSTYYVLYS